MKYQGKTVVAVDTETTGLSVYKGDRPFLVQIFDGKKYILDDIKKGKLAVETKKILQSPQYIKVFANAKFDLHMLRSIGVEVKGQIFDIFIMRHLLDETFKTKYKLKKAGLKETATFYLRMPPKDETAVKQWFQKNRKTLIEKLRPEWQKRFLKMPISRIMQYDDYEKNHILPKKDDDRPSRYQRYDLLPKELIIPYAKNDVLITLKLFEYFINEFTKLDDPELWNLLGNENELMRVLLDLECRGVQIDIDKIVDLYHTLTKEMLLIDKKLSKQYPDLNINSNKQLGDILIKDKVKDLVYTPSGQVKLDVDTINEYDHPICKMIARNKKIMKLRSTYCIGLLEACDEHGVIHCSLNSSKAVTGRFTSSDPNLQNIPRPDEENEETKIIRSLFVTRPGYINYFLDYSQIEYRIAANYFNDNDLINRINAGEDVHEIQAKRIYQKNKVSKDERNTGKRINFAVLYGAGIEKIAKALKTDVQNAERILNVFYKANPNIKREKSKIYSALKREKLIKNIFGRRYHLAVEEGYKGFNYLCQGSAADLIKFAMVDIWYYMKKHKLQTNMLLNVHDELQFEVPKNEIKHVQAFKQIMEDFDEVLKVKVVADVEFSKTNWAEKQDVDWSDKEYNETDADIIEFNDYKRVLK